MLLRQNSSRSLQYLASKPSLFTAHAMTPTITVYLSETKRKYINDTSINMRIYPIKLQWRKTTYFNNGTLICQSRILKQDKPYYLHNTHTRLAASTIKHSIRSESLIKLQLLTTLTTHTPRSSYYFPANGECAE